MGAQASHSFDELPFPQKSELTLKALTVFVQRLEEQKEVDLENSNKHLGIFCDICRVHDFENYRYKCLTCEDYDLCSSCFEERRISRQHLTGHPVVRFHEPNTLFGREFLQIEINMANFEKEFGGVVHQSFGCDVCGQSPIRGLRFGCYVCKNYNLCLSCFKQKRISKEHRTDHQLIVYGKASIFYSIKVIITQFHKGFYVSFSIRTPGVTEN